MKRIRLQLTGVGSVLTELAEKKIEKGENYQVPTCSNGKTVEFYDNIGIPIPSKLVEKLKKQDKGIKLKLEDEDFEDVYSDVSIYEEDILFKITDDEGITTLFLRDSNITLTVLETCNMIDDFIDYQNKSWIGKVISFLSLFFSRNKEEQTEIEQ